MKPLIRRLSRIADSSSSSSSSSESYRCNQIRCRDVHQPSSPIYYVKRVTNTTSSVPSGHVPVNVGDTMERFVVSAELLNHPVFVGLLNRSANEYGFAQKGVLHIPCNVFVFEKVVEILRSGFVVDETRDYSELVASLSGDDLSLWSPETTE